MKKKWGYGVIAVCGIVLAGCSTGGTSSTGESSNYVKMPNGQMENQ